MKPEGKLLQIMTPGVGASVSIVCTETAEEFFPCHMEGIAVYGI
jgi:hypothetical protein